MKRSMVGLVVALIALTIGIARVAEAQQMRWHGDYFPNVALQDQDGRTVRFYDDLIRHKVVAINFVYTSCTDICPLDTAQLRRVQEILGDRVGRDIFMYSISINPERDTPQALRRFMRTYDIAPGWTFLTGSQADVTLLQRRLGITPADPNDLRSHNTSVIIGNENTGQWLRRSAYENPQNLAELLGVAMQNYAPTVSRRSQSYAVAGEVVDTSRGSYLFRTRCITCHTMGEGDRLGPDLAGVASARPEAWLSRWIREPDRMIAERDPTALTLLGRYRNLPMPNLGMSEIETTALIAFMRGEDQRRATAAHAPPRSAH